MKATGTIIIKDLELVNPVMEVKGIFDSIDPETEEFQFKYLECLFTCDNLKGLHSRYWIVETDDVNIEFAKIDELKYFK